MCIRDRPLPVQGKVNIDQGMPDKNDEKYPVLWAYPLAVPSFLSKGLVIMLPFIFFALYEKDGQPAEKYLYHIVQSMFIRDKVRPYRTNNLYAEIQKKIKEQEELQLEEQHSKGKA